MYKARVHAALEPDLFHFRDDRGLDVDLILDRGSDIMGVECKAGATVASKRSWSASRLSYLT